jgi:uncharacterized protein (TIGR00369 family)
MIDGRTPVPPLANLIGIRLKDIGEGSVTMEMEAGKKHWNPMKTVHGGFLCDITDAAMDTTFFTTLAEGEDYTTVDLSIKSLSPVIEDTIIAQALAVKRGKRLGSMECELWTANGDLAAKANSSCIVIRVG